MSDEPKGWLAEVRVAIDRKNLAIAEALEQRVPIIGSDPAYWIDLAEEARVAVYVVAGEWLHVLRGPVDVLPPPILGEPYESRAEHRPIRITAAATWSSSVVVVAHRSLDPGGSDPSPSIGPTVREWTFEIGDETLTLRSEVNRSGWPRPDPSPFAERLALAITDARAD